MGERSNLVGDSNRAVDSSKGASNGALDARPQIGLHFFTARVLLSLMVTIWIEHIAKHAGASVD